MEESEKSGSLRNIAAHNICNNGGIDFVPPEPMKSIRIEA